MSLALRWPQSFRHGFVAPPSLVSRVIAQQWWWSSEELRREAVDRGPSDLGRTLELTQLLPTALLVLVLVLASPAVSAMMCVPPPRLPLPVDRLSRASLYVES